MQNIFEQILYKDERKLEISKYLLPFFIRKSILKRDTTTHLLGWPKTKKKKWSVWKDKGWVFDVHTYN